MKKPNRLARIAMREVLAEREREVEKYVRSQMRPELVASAKKAAASFKSESFGLFSRESTHEGQKEVR